ncbi:MAG: prepilin peptidase [Rubrimonas sp.]
MAFGTPAAAALWLLVPAIPVGIWVAWSDMKAMRIPNMAVLALTLGFFVFGLIALPLADWGWRWLHLAVVLVIGFLLTIGGVMGAGDAKFAAAMAPFFAAGDLRLVLALFAAVLLAAFVSHRTLRAVPAFRRAAPDWASWTHAKFPMGLALTGTLIFYLALAAAA